MEKFKSFITEEEDKDEPYKLVVFQNSNDIIRDIKDSQRKRTRMNPTNY